ncbi:PAS-domain containing protein [Erythrobacter sp. SCSIO 43205]|uniref:sensor histidine kinase n=1 Tax=Erythrobacter sp. SCSIO 43205 TaxID=2779361 RepID=UPI001CA8A96B|nr:PAS-domain containing protein [Erythrobacter sp. SCSIO 43205]UAB77727.1 PAS-domain containing protein [Erythrobacter sp. SCSIO 43205]
MMFGAAIAAVTAYLIALFWLASWRDRAGEENAATSRTALWLTRNHGLVYGLSLGVYCTSWTFFGGVGTAARDGLDFLPIYLGPFLVFTVGFALVRKILAQSKAQHSTSIADFLSARYGKSASVAALVALIATVGSVPYMALQLRSVGTSLLMLSPELQSQVAADELVLMVTGLMALFAILFGARRADKAGENAGLVLTIAVESAVKLVALLALALVAIFLLWDAPQPGAGAPEIFNLGQIDARFMTLTLIAACAALCLPRQFHMTFVEAEKSRPDAMMRWSFPGYLLLTSIAIVPIVLAGLSALPTGTNADTIVLALPLALGNEALALLVFIGGFSASVGMIVVASVALSTMITNDLIAPLVFREALSGKGDRSALADRLLMTRRLVIAVLLGLGYIFYIGFGTLETLAGLGILAFAALAQFAPGLVLGVLSQLGNRAGMIAGLCTGFSLWMILLIGPLVTGEEPAFSIHSDPLVSGVLLSLGANIAVYWLGSLLIAPSLVDAAQAAAFASTNSSGTPVRFSTRKRVADVRLLLAQFVGKERADASIAALPGGYRDNHEADAAVIEMAERTISGVVGSSSARMLVGSWVGGDPVPLQDVVAMFDETSKRLSFSGELLQIAIENIDQGIALVDAEMHLVAWNSRYQEMFELPDELVSVGTPIADLIRYNLARTNMSEAEVDANIERRLAHMRAGTEHRVESEQYDGRIMRIVGSPTPGGGYTTSYTDITADRRAEEALEDQVALRTAQLSEANQALEEATQSKTRFLAAASHDLIQPLNAARLFASALGEEVAGRKPLERLVKDLDGSIQSADRLIRALLDISKLDSGGIEPCIEEIAVERIFDELVREFEVQANAKSLSLRRVHTSAVVATDRVWLTSALRNLVSNAVRYTPSGGILLGVRRKAAEVRICVLDTGRGIAEEDIETVFDEFNRGTSTDREGLGLGLAIVRRAARLLDIHVETNSVLGKGTQFSLHMPLVRWQTPEKASKPRVKAHGLHEARVLIVDNEPAALAATSALLEKWGLLPVCADGLKDAMRKAPVAPDLVIMDFRLDREERGDGVYAALCEHWAERPPAILLTAEASEETEAAAQAMGANRLLKPSSPAALRALISGALAKGASRTGEAREAAE